MGKLMVKLIGIKKFINHARFQIIDDFQKYNIDKHLIYHDSFDGIINKTNPSINHLKFTLMKITIITLHIIKDSLFSLYTNEDTMALFGDPFHIVFKNVRYIYSVYVSISLVGFFVQILIFFMETNNNSSITQIFQILFKLKSSYGFYRLKCKHEKKLMIRSRLLFEVFKFSVTLPTSSLAYLILVWRGMPTLIMVINIIW